MADVTAQFLIYRGHDTSDLKHVASVMKQSNFRDGLQLIDQNPFNKNIFIDPKNVKSIIKFLVPHKPLNNIDLVPYVLLFFTSNLILTKEEYLEFVSLVNKYNSKNSWKSDWASLEDETFLEDTKPFIELIDSRISQISHLDDTDSIYSGKNLLVTTFFTSPVDNEQYSVISLNTGILSYHNTKRQGG